MAVDIQAVTKIARLARIALSAEEKERLSHDLTGAVKWFEQLNEVNTDGVPQMTSVAAIPLPWRDDIVTDGNQRDDVVKNAPISDYGCFVVPKVLE